MFFERSGVPIGDSLLVPHRGFDSIQLGAPDRSLDVGHAVVVSERDMVVSPFLPLIPKNPQPFGDRVVVGRDHATFTGRQVLVREEAEHVLGGLGTDRHASVGSAKRLGAVGDYGEAMRFRKGIHLVVVHS